MPRDGSLSLACLGSWRTVHEPILKSFESKWINDIRLIWGDRRESNPQHSAPQADALPLSYDHHNTSVIIPLERVRRGFSFWTLKFAPPAGVEPTTLSLEPMRSVH